MANYTTPVFLCRVARVGVYRLFDQMTLPLADRSYTVNRMNNLKKALRQVACLMPRYQAELLPRMLCTLLQTRSVNLQWWTVVLAGSAHIASPYRRLQRFLRGSWSLKWRPS